MPNNVSIQPGIVHQIKIQRVGTQGANGSSIIPKGAWSGITTYAKGDLVTYSGRAFLSLGDGNTNHIPPTADEDNAFWVWLPATQGPPGDGFLPRGQWSNVISYHVGDFVRHNGRAFVSMVADNLNHVPPGSDTDNAYWMFLPTVSGEDGDDGREVQLQVTATHIQWRYAGVVGWTDLIARSALRGEPGLNGQDITLQVTGTHIQWKLGTGAWTNLIALADLKGTDAKEIEVGTSATHIRWRRGTENWVDLVALSSLAGANGQEVSLQVTGTHIQWRLGTGSWTNLVALSVLKGDPGIQGPAGTIAIGTVTTLAPGQQATVENVGTGSAAVLNIGLPAGNDGEGAGSVTSVGLIVPAGFSVSGSPVVSAGSLEFSYASGYQGYTSVEAGKLAGIAANATANDTDANLKNRANHTGTQTQSTVTNLTTDLAAKAPLDSPALTGNPTAPTQTAGNNTTRLATTAFVSAAIAALIDGAPGAIDTLNELAAALGDDPAFATTVNAAIAARLVAVNNLSDLVDPTTALTNLGLSANGRALVVAANYAAMRALLDLEPGTDFYSISAANAAFAAFSHSHPVSALSDASANARTLLQAANYAAMKTLLALVKADVGLGNVDNTSDSTKNSATATLSGKTLQNPIIDGTIREDIFPIVDGTSVVLNPANGSIQKWFLGADRTPSFSGWSDGDSMTLLVDDGSARSLTLIGVVWAGGTAPTLATSGFTELNITQENGIRRGVKIGEFAS